jgi:hypothetical protein
MIGMSGSQAETHVMKPTNVNDVANMKIGQ